MTILYVALCNFTSRTQLTIQPIKSVPAEIWLENYRETVFVIEDRPGKVFVIENLPGNSVCN